MENLLALTLIELSVAACSPKYVAVYYTSDLPNYSE